MLFLEIKGAGEIRACARQLGIEERALRSGATRALMRGVRELRRTIPEAAARLPSGYAPTMAGDVQVSTSVRFASDPTISVRVWAEGGPAPGHRDVEAIDAGTLRHPFFGDRGRWYNQAVRSGFASDPFQATRPAVLAAIGDEWDAMVSRVERG